jgi:hypothetical protein
VSQVHVVMVKCPITGREFSTGIEMDAATFERASRHSGVHDVSQFRLDHIWSTREPWLGNPASVRASDRLADH